jgi:hypothetical protein
MAKLPKIWGSREIKQGSNPSRRGPRLNLIGVPNVQVYLNGEYFGATAGNADLTARSIYTTSSTQSIAFGQIQVLGATNINSGTTVGQPLLQQVQSIVDLVANGITTGVIVDKAIIGQVHAIGSNGIRTDSKAGQATLGVIFHLDTLDIDSGSRTGQPAVNQIHAFIPLGIDAVSEVGLPSIAIGANSFGQVCIGGTFRNVIECQIVVSGEWKTVTDIFLASGESWKYLGA